MNNHSSHRRTLSRWAQRRGALYIAVLGASIIVSLLSLSVMHGVRINLRRATSMPDRVMASLLADSAIEHALATIQADANWRSNYASGVSYPVTPVAMNGGTFTWQLIDSDGNLVDNTADSVVVRATALVGKIHHVVEVTLQPTETGLSASQAALHCHGNIDLPLNTEITTNTFVSSNGNITALLGSISGSAEAAGTVSGFVSGTKTPGVPPRQMPDGTVWDYYLHQGTLISSGALANGSRLELANNLLSPNNNPWGPTNPEGIYIVDCANQELVIKQLRVYGTLVLLNPGGSSRFEQEVLFEPAISNFPSLLVEGNMEFRFDSEKELNESGVNFNPPGTPYRGVEDGDTNDKYPCVMRGLVYVSGQMNLTDKDLAFEGVVICGSIAPNTDCSFTYRPWYFDYPPPGFGAGSQMQIIPGSWRRAPSP